MKCLQKEPRTRNSFWGKDCLYMAPAMCQVPEQMESGILGEVWAGNLD